MKKYKLYFKKGTSVYEDLQGQEVIIDEGHLDVLAEGGTLPITVIKEEGEKKVVNISYLDLSMTLSVKN
jgi:hypothetical protein